MKLAYKIIFICMFICTVKSAHTNNKSGTISSQSLGSAQLNKFKELKNPFGKHSLFTGNNGSNISKYFKAVPPPVPDKIPPPPAFQEPERLVAERLVNLYRKQFDYLDSIVVNDLVDPQELSQAYTDFKWPKALTDVVEDVEYSKTVINKYDKENKGGLNFVDFCMFAEELWEVSDSIQEQKCGSGFDKAMEIWDGFFKWLDRDSDGFLQMEDMIYGISKMMYRDVDMDEVQKVFVEYGGAVKKLSYDNFVLAIANNMLDKSLKDPNYTETLAQ